MMDSNAFVIERALWPQSIIECLYA